MIRRYYKIEFELTEPLSLGSGENKYSDRDLLKNSLGEPFIPGSSLAGIYRDLFNKEHAEKYFGSLYDKSKVEGEGQQLTPSNVIVYDAVLKEGKCSTSIRDSVGLDEFKTAKDGAKFDFEIVEPGATFVTYVEQICDSKDELDAGKEIAEAYQAGRIYFGHKTTRGYGGVKATHIWSKEFDLSDVAAISSWINFDMYDEESFSTDDIFKSKDDETDICKSNEGTTVNDEECCIKLFLQLRDGISIRRYTTEVAKKKGESVPDYTQMYYTGSDGEEKPCIPGTTWAGAFRHHIKQLLPEEQGQAIIDTYFGHSKGKDKKKSKVRFSESQIQGSTSKVITRNAIDRFTGGTIDGALYTEKAFFGGKTDLTITFPKKAQGQNDQNDDDALWKKALAAVITDLDQGFLAIGGLTAVGRGLFHVTGCSYNGKTIYPNEQTNAKCTKDQPDLYCKLIAAMNGEGQGGEEV